MSPTARTRHPAASHRGHAMRRTAVTALAIACAAPFALAAQAQDKVLNLYSARHYPTDEALYSGFEKATGIKIRRITGDDAGIVARLKAEGAGSAADVVLLVDAARLWRAEADGLFRPMKSAVLEQAIVIAAFIPLVLTLCESVAIQSLTLAIQSMHASKVNLRQIRKLALRAALLQSTHIDRQR